MNVVLRTLCGCEKIVAAPQTVINGIEVFYYRPLPSLAMQTDFEKAVETRGRTFKHIGFEHHEPSGKDMHIFGEVWE